jgi:acyl-coenzyme A thioesterase PaaI-like protein
MTEPNDMAVPVLTDDIRSELAERWNTHPGIARIGARLEIVSANELRATVDPIEPHHRGGMGTSAVNGPTIAAIFDLVTGLTGYLQAPGKRAAVAQLNIRFLRPVLGSRFEVVGRPERTGHSLVFVGCALVDEANVVCAQCDGLVSISQADGTGELAL